MERRIGYYLYDGDREEFVSKLTSEGFKVPSGKEGALFSLNDKASKPLALIGKTFIMVNPKSDYMNEYDVSEMSRLIKICDEFKDFP